MATSVTRIFFVKGHLIRDSTEILEESKGQCYPLSTESWWNKGHSFKKKSLLLYYIQSITLFNKNFQSQSKNTAIPTTYLIPPFSGVISGLETIHEYA